MIAAAVPAVGFCIEFEPGFNDAVRVKVNGTTVMDEWSANTK